MSEQTQPPVQEPAPEPVTIEFSHKCRVNQAVVETLDVLLDFVHPSELRRDLTNVLLYFLMHECDALDDDFKQTAQNYLMLFDWLDTVEQEMDERGFTR
jgi:hypothetical protein